MPNYACDVCRNVCRRGCNDDCLGGGAAYPAVAGFGCRPEYVLVMATMLALVIGAVYGLWTIVVPATT